MPNQPKIAFKCVDCGSTNITCTADVWWSIEQQAWIADDSSVSEENFCYDCTENVRVRTVEVIDWTSDPSVAPPAADGRGVLPEPHNGNGG